MELTASIAGEKRGKGRGTGQSFTSCEILQFIHRERKKNTFSFSVKKCQVRILGRKRFRKNSF